MDTSAARVSDPTAAAIVACARNSLGLGQLMARDVPPERFARLAAPGGTTVLSNHPAFVFGHLAGTSAGVCRLLGDDAGAAALAPPPSWNELFGMGATCRDDPDGALYPAKDELVEAFSRGFERILATIATLPAERLAEPNPMESMRERLGLHTLGEALNFVTCSHPMMHLGQVSAWRRMEGLGSALGF